MTQDTTQDPIQQEASNLASQGEQVAKTAAQIAQDAENLGGTIHNDLTEAEAWLQSNFGGVHDELAAIFARIRAYF